jgi:hypothetical protein
VTRKDFSYLLIISTFILLAARQDVVSLCAFIAVCAYDAGLWLVPVAFDSQEEKLRREFSDALAVMQAEIHTQKNRVDALTMRQGVR